MFVGHLGVGLALKRAEPRLNLGWWFLCAMLLDVVLWLLVLLGFEGVRIPPDYAERRYLAFHFPYSHSIAAGVGWSILTFLAARVRTTARTAMLLALATGSHLVLDWLVHPPDIHVVGDSSLTLGLGLWDKMPLALATELGLLAAGYVLYLSATRPTSRRGRFALGIFLGAIAAMAVGGQLLGPTPTSPREIAASSVVVLVVVFGIAAWFDRWRAPVESRRHAAVAGSG